MHDFVLIVAVVFRLLVYHLAAHVLPLFSVR